jgi:hypothetical protein
LPSPLTYSTPYFLKRYSMPPVSACVVPAVA